MESLEIEPTQLPSLCLHERSDLPSYRACYFVLQSEDILYIGRTENLNKRWRGHHLLRAFQKLEKVRIAWIEVKPHWLLEDLERELIKAFEPKINKPPLPENTCRLTFDIPASLHRKIKMQSIEQGVTMSDMLRKLFEKHFSDRT